MLILAPNTKTQGEGETLFFCSKFEESTVLLFVTKGNGTSHGFLRLWGLVYYERSGFYHLPSPSRVGSWTLQALL